MGRHRWREAFWAREPEALAAIIGGLVVALVVAAAVALSIAAFLSESP